MRWLCSWEKEMGCSSSCSSLCPRSRNWLWFNTWWYNANIFSGSVPCSTNGWWSNKGEPFLSSQPRRHCTPALSYHDILSCNQGSLLIAEVMEGRGYQVQPGCRVPRHDVVQVSHMLIFNVLILNNDDFVLFCWQLKLTFNYILFPYRFVLLSGSKTWKPGTPACLLWSCAEKLSS